MLNTGHDILDTNILASKTKNEKPLKIARYKYTIPDNSRSHIYVIGTGGTGGYVARDVARLIYSLRNKYQIGLSLIDPDTVEERNILRQNFVEEDIGRNKAEVLAERYSGAFGIEIASIPNRFTSDILVENTPYILIGCVDNNKARRDIARKIKTDGFYGSLISWIDSGNESTSGQVIMGTTGRNYCNSYLPFVVEEYPELADPKNDPEDTTSCAERAQRDIQNIFVNLTAANHILNFLNIIYSGKECSARGVEFNIFGASKPLILDQLRPWNNVRTGSEGIWQVNIQSERAA